LINADPNAQANGLVAGAVGDRLVLQTAGSGASETFDIDGGTALGALGWSAGTTVAGHDLAVSVEISGAYTGDTNDRYTFVPTMDGTVGTTNGLKILVLDSTGAQVAALDVGVGYVPGDEIEVLNGVRLELSYGTLSATDHDVFELDVTADSDTADLLSALGLNGLFTGYDAGSIGVRADIITDPILLAGSQSGAPGDGTNLLALLELDDQTVGELGQITIGQYYSDIISGVGLQIGSTESALDAELFLLQSLEARRDQISGVNVDEEMVNLITSEQAFNAASQFLRVTAELSEELMSIL
jgi:flagellar hook-associated protein 1 FlgK